MKRLKPKPRLSQLNFISAVDVPGITYLLHFLAPLAHAKHYCGWTQNLEQRIEQHRKGQSSRIMEVLHERNIGFEVAKTWSNTTRKFERRLKSQGGLSRHCPICIKEGLVCPSRTQIKPIETPGGEDFVEVCDMKTAAYKTNSTQIDVPTDIAQEILAKGKQLIPDDKELGGDGRETEPHITLKYGVQDDLNALQELMATQSPFIVRLGKTHVFPPSESSDGMTPVVVEVLAPELEVLRSAIDKAIGDRTDDFEYKPHLTIAYVKPEVASAYDGSDTFEGLVFIVDAVMLSQKNGTKVQVALGGEQNKIASKQYSAEQVVEHFLSVHPTEVDEFAIHEIMKYPAWKLKEVSTKNLGCKLSEGDEPHLSMEYAKLRTPFPPVILDEGGHLIDGMHRCEAAGLRGDKTIWAFAPATPGSVKASAHLFSEADMLKFSSWLLLAIDYEEMFKQFLAVAPPFKADITREIQWAKTALKKSDRIIWYLRWVRLSLENDLAASGFIETGEGVKVPSQRDQIQALFAKDISAYNAKSPKIKIKEADVRAVLLRDLKRQLEHFFALQDPSIETFSPGYETPEHVIGELEKLEDEIRVKVESEKRTIAEPETESGDTVFIKFGDRWAWWLLGRAYCPEEARAMGHCGNEPRSGSDDRILSLREPITKGDKHLWSPHLTFVIDARGFLGEMKGRGNDKPVKRYHPYIITLLKDSRIKGTKGATWFASHNFKLSDLTEEERQGIYSANPNFMDPKKYFAEFGKKPEEIERLAQALNIDGENFKPEWDAFVVRQWGSIRECMNDIGNGTAEEAADDALKLENRHTLHPTENENVKIDEKTFSEDIVRECASTTIRGMMESLQREVPELLTEFGERQETYRGTPFKWTNADDATISALLYWVYRNSGYDTSVWANIRKAHQQAEENDRRWRLVDDLEYELTSGDMYERNEDAKTTLRWGDDNEFSWKVSPVYEVIKYDDAVELAASEDATEKEKDLSDGGGLDIYLSDEDYGGDEQESDQPLEILDLMYKGGIPSEKDKRQLGLFDEKKPEASEIDEETADDNALFEQGEEWTPNTYYDQGDFTYDEASGFWQVTTIPGTSGPERPVFNTESGGITMDDGGVVNGVELPGLNWVSVSRDELPAMVRQQRPQSEETEEETMQPVGGD